MVGRFLSVPKSRRCNVSLKMFYMVEAIGAIGNRQKSGKGQAQIGQVVLEHFGANEDQKLKIVA
jgi:hypothetical protein